MSTTKVHFDSTNFVISHVVERGEWIFPKRLENEKEMKNGLIDLFCLRVMVIKCHKLSILKTFMLKSRKNIHTSW